MPDDVVIRFENVSKRYKRTFGGLRHLVQDTADRLLGRTDGNPREERYLWALKDVSFEVRRGEILGIIGLNGAGKSTILKLASRITHPTEGNIEVDGQVGALIEVGAGFHPELTGRENVYLNGSILGMSRQQIETKYKSIVEFAELDGFMDMPVKRYSSGMYLRLGFAVAAHLDPDIFLIDEVLSVGDAGFRAKCLNKIEELKERDTTIILVSHNMVNIARYSDQVLWIDGGLVKAMANPDETVEAYLYSIQSASEVKVYIKSTVADHRQAESRNYEDGSVTIKSVVMTKEDGTVSKEFKTGEVVQVHITYFAKYPMYDPVFGISIIDAQNQVLGALTTKYDGYHIDEINGLGIITFQFDPIIFLRGTFKLDIHIREGNSLKNRLYLADAATFSIIGPPLSNRLILGNLLYPHKWISDKFVND